MDPFSYLSVLLSIILGLAITQLLQGLRGLLLARGRVQGYWPSVVWALALLLMYVQSWWAMFELRDVPVWTFDKFCVVLLQSIFSYMLAALVFPDFGGHEAVDLRAHYFDQAKWFFGLTVALLACSAAKPLLIYGHWPDAVDGAFHGLFVAIALSAMATRRDAYHKAVSLFAALMFAVYTLVLFSRLR